MGKLLDGYCRVLEALMALVLCMMIAMVFGNVMLRYLFNAGISVSEELSRWGLVWLTFLGAVVALHERGHLGTDVVVARLPRLGKKLCLVAGQGLMAYASWLLLTGSWTQAGINMGTRAPASGIPVGVIDVAVVFFSVSSLAIIGYELWRVLSGRATEAELVMVRDSEELEQVEELHLDRSLGPASAR